MLPYKVKRRFPPGLPADIQPAASESAWENVPVVETAQEIVCRTSNRVFVGVPLFLNSRFAVDVATDANILNVLPKFLIPLVSKKLPNTAAGDRLGIWESAETIGAINPMSFCSG